MTDDTTLRSFAERIAIERWEGEGGRPARWDDVDHDRGGVTDERDTPARIESDSR